MAKASHLLSRGKLATASNKFVFESHLTNSTHRDCVDGQQKESSGSESEISVQGRETSASKVQGLHFRELQPSSTLQSAFVTGIRR